MHTLAAKDDRNPGSGARNVFVSNHRRSQAGLAVHAASDTILLSLSMKFGLPFRAIC
jgi:hypothetical protein